MMLFSSFIMRISRPVGSWGRVLLCLAAAGCLWAQPPERVVRQIEIRHIGPAAVSDSLVRANIRVKEGDVFARTGVEDDVGNLWKTGYFINVRLAEEPLPDGIKLVFVVQGNPTITQILFTGNRKYSTSKLRKKISSRVGEPLNERKLFSDSQVIRSLYQKAGHQKTEVKYVPVIDNKLGKGTVTFEITEAPKVKIQDVRFPGAESFKQGKLRRLIKTRRHWMFSWITGSGTFKDEQFQDDRERLADFYRNEGFIDFDIKEVQLEPVNPKRVIVQIFISEGTRYRVGSVDFDGNKLFDSDEIKAKSMHKVRARYRPGLGLGEGEVFSPRALIADRDGVEDFYGARGYIDAQVAPVRVPNTERGTIDLTYKIDEGHKSYIEQIEIRGNTKTKDRVIRRELAVNPGEVFDMVRVKLSTNRLYGLRFFSRVDATPEPTSVAAGDRKNLVITVEEQRTGNVQLGAGISSLDSLVGYVEFTQGNFDLFKQPVFLGTGAGQKMRLRVQLGTRRKDFVFTFIEPWFLNRKLTLSTDFYHRELQYYSDLYDIALSGVRVGLTRTLWNDYWRGGVSYTIENVGHVDMDRASNGYDPVPAEIRAEEGHTLVSKVGASIDFDTRNNTLLPSRGQRTVLEAEVAGGPMGGETDFYKLELRNSRYIRGLAPGHILELTSRIGVVDNYGLDETVHLYDRFYLGGLTSLRGYHYRDIGPFDPTGEEPIGGRTYWFASAEYSIPIIERLRLAAFYDIGNVYPFAYSFKTYPDNRGPFAYGAYSDNWGVGIRLNIPLLGPLRLDYAIPIQHDDYVNGNGRFQFGVGFYRDY